jgi:2,3,4,5-tetrahydropyridine-2-carboxylate N-succinyltransferase
VLLSFRLNDMSAIRRPGQGLVVGQGAVSSRAGARTVFATQDPRRPRRDRAPPAFIARNVALMLSFVNLGAYVDEATMIDTWSTVGSCAQIGKRVHISGGVGIGGVLEPLQAEPVIIEDDCFIGARRSRRRRDRAQGRGAGDGRIPRRLHQDRRPRHRRDFYR